MTRQKHTSLLKLAAIIIAVVLVHSGHCSESAPLRYEVSSLKYIVSSNNIFTYNHIDQDNSLQLNCPKNITTICDIDICSAHISNGLDVEVVKGIPVSVFWKMEGATEATSSQIGINQIGNFVFNEGVTFVTYTAVDNLGDAVTCSFSVVVTDKQAPVISVPENIYISCNDRIPSPYTTLQAFYNAGGKASDNCNLNPVTFKLESEQKSNLICPYKLTRTYQIADRQGNIGQAKQIIFVEKRSESELSEEEKRLQNLKSGMVKTITSTAIGGIWNDGTSWVGGIAPLPGDDVVVATGATISMTGNQICNNVTINGTLNCGGNTLQVKGNWANNGAFNAGTGTVEFVGITNATLSGSSSTIFKNFKINKGAVGSILQFNKDIQLGGTITFTSGLMQINSGVTVNCTFNTGFTIENNAGIFINGGSFTTGTFSVNNNGLFRIDSGTATIGSNSGNSIVVASNGTLDINGGTVNVAGRLEVSGGTVDISGGTINLNTVGQNRSFTGSLDLSLSSKFTMSAGTVNFVNPNGSGNYDVIMLNGAGGSKTFSGGTFNFGDGTTDTYKISSAVPFPNITSTANTNLEYKLILTSTGTYNFPLVDNSGTVIPATVQFTGGTFSPGAFIEVKTTGTKYYENKSSTNYLNRYWNVSTSGISSPSYNFTAKYANGDVGGNEAGIAMGSWSGSKRWTRYSNANVGANSVTANRVTNASLVFAGITSDPPTVDITNGVSVTICSGSSVILASTVSGDPVITYSWSPATGLSATNIASPVASPTATTTYTVTITDGNGFEATDNFTVNVNTNLKASAEITSPVLTFGGTAEILLTPIGGTPPYTFYFQGKPSNQTGLFTGVVGSASGTEYNWSVSDSLKCATVSGTITINEPSQIKESSLKLKSGMGIEALVTQDYTAPGTYTFTVPPGVTSLSVEAWGSGAGGDNTANRGGGGGAYAANYSVTVVPGATYTVVVGAGAAAGTGDNGQASRFGNIVIAAGGTVGNGGTVAASTGAVRYAGGNGGSSSGNGGAGGGGSAGGGGNGGNGGNTNNNTGGAAGAAGAAGAGTAGATGGAGGNSNTNGVTGNYPGGGGGERGQFGAQSGGGGNGRVLINWNIADDYCYGYGYAVYAQTGVGTPDNALNSSDNTGAVLNEDNDVLDLDLTGGGVIRPSGSEITIFLRRTTNQNASVAWFISSNGSSWTANGTYSTTVGGWTNITITLAADTRYLRIDKTNNRGFEVDAITYDCCTDPAQPSVISGNTNPCPGSSETYSVTNVSGVTYTWSYSGNNANISSGQGTNSINVNYAANATSGTWTVTPSVSTCTGTARTLAVTMSTPSTNPTSVTGTNAICIGGSTTLTTVGGTLGTDADDVWYEGGCANEIVTEEWMTLPFSVTNTNVNSISGGTMSVTSTNGDPMIWMTNIGNFNTVSYKYIQIRYRVVSGTAGSVEIYYTKNGGADLSESQVVRAALVSDGNWNIVNVDMSTSGNWTGNITGWRYDWSSQNGVTMQLDFITLSDRPIIGTGTSITVSPTATTTYYTRKKGACNSTNCISRTVTVNPLPTITLDPNAVTCQGSTGANLYYSALTNSPNQYSIDYDGAANTAGFIDVNNAGLPLSPIVLTVPFNAAPNVYNATLTVRNFLTGCVSEISDITVTVNENPSITLGANPSVCQGTTSASLPYSATVGSPDVYNIDYNAAAEAAGFTDVTNATLAASPIVLTVPAGAAPATYNATLTVGISATGCISSSSNISVMVYPVPTMSSANSKTICSDENVNLALTSVVASSYTWVATDNSNITGESTTSQTSSTISDILVNTTTSVQTVTYTVTPTSTTGGCPGTPQTVTITVNPAPTMSSANSKTICSGENVNLALTSVVPSSYTWIATDNSNVTGESTSAQNGSTLSDVLVNTSTSVQTVTYTVTPTSTTGSCPGTPQTVTITVNPAPTMSNADSKTICSGDNINLVLTSVVPSSYTWVAADNTNITGESTTSQSSSTISDILVNTTTSVQTVTYSVTPTSTTGSCPGTSQTVTITVNPAPTMSNADAKTICSGENVSLALTSVVASSYIWVATDNSNITGESTTSQSSSTISDILVNTSTSVQTVTYTVTPTSTTGSCQGVAQTVTITVNPAPTMSNANAKTICSGDNINLALTSVVASSYTWVATDNSNITGESTSAQSGSTISDVLVNISTSVQTVTYTVTPTSTAGSCPGTPQTVTITVNPAPTMSNANSKTICSDENVSLALTSAVASSYTWVATDNTNITGESTTSQSSSTISDILVNTTTSVQTVTYTVTPTSSTGSCPGTPQTVTITVNPTPTMSNADAKTICSGDNINLALTSVVPSSYSWIATDNSNVTGESTSAQNGSTLSDVLVNTSTSVQTVTYTITPTSTTGSCSGTPQTVTITVNPAPTMSNADVKTICSGDNINLALTSVVASSYTWVATDNSNITGESTSAQTGSTLSDVLVNTSISVQTVTYTVTPTSTTGSCPGTPQTVTITVNPAPTMSSANSKTICSGENVSLALTSVVPSSYTWVAADNSNITGESTTSQSSSTISDILVNTTTSVQTVTYTVTPTSTAGSCPGVAQTVTITVNPTPTMSNANSKTICSGENVSLALTSVVASSYTWVAADNSNITGESTTSQSSSNISDILVNTTTSVQTVTYTVTPTSSTGGCPGTPQTVTITVNPAPVVNIGSALAAICQGGTSASLGGSVDGSAIGGTWTTPVGGTFNPSANDLNATWTPPAVYSGTATLTLTTSGGTCGTVSDSKQIIVTPTVGTPTAVTISAGTEPSCQLTNGATTTTYTTTATNSTGFNWSISNPAAGSIDPTTGVMTWNDGFTGTVDIQVTANGCNGPSAQIIRTVYISPTVGTPTVPDPSATTICQGSGNTVYTTSASDATSYNWTVTGAGNTISGTGTTGTVTWNPAFSGLATISVTADGCNGPSAAASTTVMVLPTPDATITGNNSVCQNTAYPDVVFTNPQSLPVTVTYKIGVGANQTIDIAANSTASVQVPTTVVGDFDYNLVSVKYQLSPECSTNISGSVTVTIRPEAPVAPAAITGNNYVIPATSETYSIAAVANAASYTWIVPAGWTITSGQGTTSITVTSGIAGEGGDIKVIAKNDCGDSPETTFFVDINPDLAIVTHPVSQSDCYNNTVLFGVSISGGAAPIVYTWQRKKPADIGFTDIVGDADITYPSAGSMLVANIGSASNPDGTQYRVRITDNGGSDETTDPATLTVNEVLSMSPLDVNTEICEGENAAFNATTGGETPISMRWEKDGLPVTDDAVISGSATTNISFTNARPSDAGEYRLTVTFPMSQPNNNPGNPNNCTVTSTVYRTLVVNPLPVLTGPAEVCVGQTINLMPNAGGTWVSNNPANASISNSGVVTGVTPGIATFTFTETATGCSSTTSTVTVYPLPSGEIAGNTDICESNSTSFTVTLTGTSPWSITYTDGTTPVTVTGITSSPYTVTVSPAASTSYTLSTVSDAYCDATSLTGSAVITVHPLPTAELSGNTTICVGTSANLSVSLTGSQPWNIEYTDGVTPVTVTGITSSPYQIVVTPGTTTTYSLTAVSDANCSGTSFTGTATVMVDQLPSASAGGSQTICSNSTATVSGAHADNGTILWTHNGAGTLADATALTPTYTAATADAGNTVILTMTVTSNNTCSASANATATYTINVDPLPTATAGGSQTICSNGTAAVSGASADNGTILWTHNGSGSLTGETTLTPLYTAGATDAGNTVILTMTVTGNGGCSTQTATATYSININPEAQVNTVSNQELCTGSATTMVNFSTTNVTGTTTYSWTNSEPSIGLAASGNGSIIPFTAVNSGNQPVIANITVTPHLTNGGILCDGPSKTFTITVNPVPVATAPIGLIYCNGELSDPYTLTGTPTGVLFDISGGAAIGLANVNGVTAIPAFTPITGTATLTIIPKSNGCSGLPVSFNVTVRPTPTATISGGATVCQNSAPPNISIANPMTLTVLVTYNINGTGSYVVNVPASSNVPVPVPTNTAGPFQYNLVSVQYLNSEPPICSNTAITGSATINVTPQPVPVITGPTNICAETTGNVYTTEAGMSNYSWVVSAGGTITAGGNAASNTVTVTWNTGGSHNVSVGYTDVNGCTTSTPTVFPVNVYPLPIPTITGSTSACLGSTNVVYSTQPGMTNYQWSVSAGATITAGGTPTSNSVTVTWNTTGPQTISVNYKNTNGCEAAAPTVKNITVNPLPVPTLAGPDFICAGTTGNVYSTEAGMTGYIWTVSSGGTITAGGTVNSNTATIRWNTDGPQTVRVSYTNASGCTPSSQSVFPVTVYPKPVPTITGPASACLGSTGNVYTTEAGMSNYSWTVASGGTITSGGGSGDNSVTISWTTAGAKTVKVNYANANGCGASTQTTSNVTVYALPNPVIAGPNKACVGSAGNVYSTVAGMSNYVWTVSAGGTITSGGTLTDHEVTVTWDIAGPQTVSLNYTNLNGCAAAVEKVYAVTVNPLPTPTITGPLNGCTGIAGTVYTTEPGMTGYSWSVTGGTITSGGSGTDNTATVVWNSTGVQTISVNYYNTNSCTALTPTIVNVNVVDPNPPACPADFEVCSNVAPFNLTGGVPTGGVYSGPGVTFVAGNYRFTPSLALAGPQTITYTMPNVCADKCTFTITVKPVPTGSASAQTICSGDTTNIVLNSTVSGTTFTWTAANTSGSVSGFANCSGTCDPVIRQALTNNSVRYPGGPAGTNGVVTYTVTATKDGCSSTFTVAVTVRPGIRAYNLTWNSNFVEDYIEVCAGTEALSDNDLEILIPPANTLVPANHFNGWSPVILYGPSADGPWTTAAGSWHGNYEWNVDLNINNQLGFHYFVLQITDPVTGCVKYSNPAILNVVSSLTVEAGDPIFMCGSTATSLSGAFVGGIISSGTPQARWSITSLNPTNGGNNGSLSSTAFTTNPASVTYTPPAGYIGTITLSLTTNDPDGGGTCIPITDTRTVTVVPPSSFTGCIELAGWPLSGTNSNGTRDDSGEPCLVTLVGSDNSSGNPGTTDITHCSGTGTLSFDWSFSAPANKIVWHQEDQKVGSNSGSNIMQVAKPSNLAVGDLIIVTIHENNNTGNITNGDGFTLIRRDFYNASSQVTAASFYKIATAADVSRVTPYQFSIANNNASGDDRIYSSRITGHNSTTPIGNSSGISSYLTMPAGGGYMSITIPTVNTTVANSMIVTSLSINIDGSTGNVVEFINSPVGTTTMYYNDVETSARVAQMIKTNVGGTGGLTYQWPSYNTRNRYNMYASAQQFIINPATNEVDAAYVLVNGTPTLLGSINGAAGSKSINVSGGDVIGFRVGTTTNTGGPGKLIVYNLTMPNDAPVLTGIDTIKAIGCQDMAFVPTFIDPTPTDDCGIPVIKAGYPQTDPVVIDGCNRSQKRIWVYVDDCGAESEEFVQIATWSIQSPLTVSCPIDPNLPACTDPDMITAVYDIWKAGFVANGGCEISTNMIAVPPLILNNIACGDTLRFTFIATDICGQIDSCASTFTVQPVDALTVNNPTDPMLTGCSDIAAITAAYETWKAGFSYNGGCSSVTDNIASIPALPADIDCGGQLTFIYSASNTCGQNQSVVSTFTVDPISELSITVPHGVSLPLCTETADIEIAYNDWKAGFTTTGGCAVITNFSTFPDLSDLSCGGSLSFTFIAQNGLDSCANQVQDSSTFTIAEAPELIVNCPVDPNIAGCLGIQAITDAYDTWVGGFTTTGGCNITTNIASIPPLGDMVCNGQISFTFIVENGSGVCYDYKECTSTFTIGAAPALSVIVPSDTTVQGCNTNQEIIDAFNAWKAQFGYAGGCNVTTSDLSAYSVPSSCGGTVTVEYTATDNCGQSVTGSANFTLNPDVLTATCPDDEVQAACQTQAEIDDAFVIWKAKFGFNGGCGAVPTDLSSVSAPSACGGTIIVNYSVADVCGQVSNCSAIFTIDAPSDVLQEPSFTVPVDITVNRDASCNYDADPAITGVPTNLFDNCTDTGNLTMNYTDSIAAGLCPSDIIIYRKWTILDNCLNETTKIQIITVEDNTPPVVVCAPDVNGVADNSECEATGVNLGTTTATDNCQVASLAGVRSDGFQITDPFPVGVTTITWTATDACGNSSSCIQTITMEDGINQPPTITCPGDVVQNAGPNNCYLENVVIPNPTADDNCEVATISWIMTGATTGSSPLTGFNYVGGETFNVGLTTVTYMATDSAGNFATCVFTVTIKDVTPPVINLGTCVDVSDNAAPNFCSKVPGTLNDPDYSDTCWPKDDLILSWEMTGATTGTGFGTVTDSAFNVGVTTVTYTVADPDGNTDDCTFTVTIFDVTDPVIDLSTCADVSENADPDNCSKTPAAIMDPTYSDNCWPVATLVLTYEITGATTGSGTGTVTGLTFNVGVSTVTYTVTDPDGNSATCSFTVTIIDVTPPVINLTKCVDVSDVAAPNNCSKVPADLEDPEYSDTCWPYADLTLSWTMTGATTGSGFGTVTNMAFNVGVTTVVYTVTDPDYNSASCSFTVTIKDVTPPNIGIAGCEDVTDVTDDGNCTVIPGDINDPVYSDACWDIADLTITWEMTGATIRTGSGSVKGESFNTGITTVIYTVSDPDGNEATCEFTVTVIPYNPPQFTAGCPPNIITAINDPGLCEADLTIPDPTVDDPCNIGYTITNDRTGTDNASGIYPVGTTEVIWTITPTVGNPTTCTQTITVTDAELPVIIDCPATRAYVDCSVAAITGPAFSATTANSSYAEFADAANLGNATDNCGIVTVTYIDVQSGNCPITITRTWTVFDAAGNSASCDQTITIDDTEAPVVDCPTAGFETPSDFDLPYATFSIPAFDYSDNCTAQIDILITWTLSGATTDSGTGLIPTPYQFNSGITTVSYVFTDLCGNPTPCEFTVFALYPPEITCLPPVTLNTDAGVCYNHIEAADLDNPGVPTNGTGEVLDWTWTVYAPDGTTVLGTGTSTGVSPTPVGPVDFPLGTSTIHWYAENASGHDECDQLVTVVDNLPPTFTADDFEDCVERLSQAIYTGNVDDIQYNPDYPNGDYKLMNPGDTHLNIDLGTYVDNCCVLADGYSMFWTIEFDGNDPTEPDITGTGQPSTYKDPISGDPLEIYLWGDGVNFQPRVHTITYTITDCNGNVSDDVTATITINPRPELIKVTN